VDQRKSSSTLVISVQSGDARTVSTKHTLSLSASQQLPTPNEGVSAVSVRRNSTSRMYIPHLNHNF
jgi:hypothetical protein